MRGKHFQFRAIFTPFLPLKTSQKSALISCKKHLLISSSPLIFQSFPLLCLLNIIAVMFTFSFGSAFAVQKADFSEAVAKINLDNAIKALKDSDAAGLSFAYTYKNAAGTDVTGNFFVDATTVEAEYDALLSAAYDYAKGTANDYVKDVDGLNALLADADNADLVKSLVAAQYEIDKADAIKNLNGASVADFSTEELKEECKVKGHTCKTYQDHVKAILADAVDTINEATFTTDSTVANYGKAEEVIKAFFGTYGEASNNTALLKELGYVVPGKDGKPDENIGLGVYEINKEYEVKDGVTLNSYTTDAVKANDATSAASIAEVKAKIAAAYAQYLATANADKTFAANMKTILEFLADEKVALGNDILNTYFVDEDGGEAAYAIKAVGTLEAEAARLAAETDANGALVRDAKDVADKVKAGKLNVYKIGAGLTTIAKTDKDKDQAAANLRGIDEAVAAAIRDAKDLYASLDDTKLAYAKKYETTKITKAYENAKDNYYAPEYAKYKALVDEYAAKIEAAKDYEEVEDLVAEFAKKNDFLNKTVVDGKAAALYTVAKQYAELLNAQIKKTDNQYYLGETSGQGNENDYAKLKAEVNKLVGNSEARTTKEINALSEQILAMVKELPTVGAVEAAKEAADDAIDAIPTKVSMADKATIDAAVAAVDAYEEISADTYEGSDLATAKTRLAYAFKNEIAAKVKAVSETDKVAIKAIVDEIDAFVDAYGNESVFGDNTTTLNGYLAKIKKTEFDAVKAAIAAIPVKENITEAAKDKVVAARALYDAYVAEYTDYSKAGFDYDVTTDTDGFVADDFGTSYQELVAAETLLGLNAVSPAELVKGLKITAKSTAKKGSITVKWTVEGEADIDGFEIYKSTKHSKGYKKAFATKKQTYKNTKGLKKGTRYYYKVRAYKVIDGVKVTSDWSNKARRIAK